MMLQQTDASLSPSLGTVFDLLVGPVRMAVLDAALKMEMADLLAKEQKTEELARTLNLEADETNLIFFLDAMSSMGFAQKKNGRYYNTQFAETYLRKGSPTYLGGMVENMSRMQHRNLNRIPELIRQGSPEILAQDKLDSEEKWKQSVRHLASYQKAGMAERVADLVAKLPDFSGMRRMLDLGCGPGIMCMTTVSRHPSMEGVLCDLPPVLDVAREEISTAGLQDRISTIDGNYNEVDFGTGYDLIWASHTLYYAKDLGTMFARIHEALNPGGIFLSIHEGLTDERTQPANIVLSRFSLALEGQDVSFERGELASYLPGAGFSFVETRTLKLPVGPLELILGRKKG